MLLVLASAVILGSEFHWTHDHILLSRILDRSPEESGTRIQFPRDQGGPVIPLRQWVAFHSLRQLARITVELLGPPASGGPPRPPRRDTNTPYIKSVHSS
jgi:hypothetical protein